MNAKQINEKIEQIQNNNFIPAGLKEKQVAMLRAKLNESNDETDAQEIAKGLIFGMRQSHMKDFSTSETNNGNTVRIEFKGPAKGIEMIIDGKDSPVAPGLLVKTNDDKTNFSLAFEKSVPEAFKMVHDAYRKATGESSETSGKKYYTGKAKKQVDTYIKSISKKTPEQIVKIFDKQENDNYHTENAVMLAHHYGSKKMKDDSKEMMAFHITNGSMELPYSKIQTDLTIALGKKMDAAVKKTSQKSESTHKGQPVEKVSCEELEKDYERRMAQRAKSQKKSKTKPVIEKVTTHIVQAAKQAINSADADKIKKDPHAHAEKMKRVEEATLEYMKKLKAIMGEEYDAEEVSDEMKELKTFIKTQESKYKDKAEKH